MQIFSNANYNFIRWRWPALALSMIVVVAGVVAIWTKGMPLGIEFSGGTQLIIKFKGDVSEQQVRDAVASFPGDEVVQQYGARAANEILIRLEQTGEEKDAGLEQTSLEVQKVLQSAKLPEFELRSRELVGPTIGEDLQRRGIYSVLA